MEFFNNTPGNVSNADSGMRPPTDPNTPNPEDFQLSLDFADIGVNYIEHWNFTEETFEPHSASLYQNGGGYLDEFFGDEVPTLSALKRMAKFSNQSLLSYPLDSAYPYLDDQSASVQVSSETGEPSSRSYGWRKGRMRLKSNVNLPQGYKLTCLRVRTTATVPLEPQKVVIGTSVFEIPKNGRLSAEIPADERLMPPELAWGGQRYVSTRLLPVEIDIRQPESTPPILLASLGAAPAAAAATAGSGSIGNSTQDDDFAVVSNGTDSDLASELVIDLPSGVVTGTVTANLKMKGSDGSLKFEQNSVTITPGTSKVIKIWGTTASSGENKSKVEIELVMPGGGKSTIEEDLTIIDGVKISFEGTFYSPVDSRIENWRPSTIANNSRGVDDDPAVIAADVADFTSNISFTDGDQPVSYRAWSPKPKVTVSKVEAVNPPMELKKDPLKGAEVHMTSGAFQHFASALEKIEHPNLVFKTGGAGAQTFFSTSIVDRADDTPITTNFGANPGGVALNAKVSAAATGGNMLAKWLRCQTSITPITNRPSLTPAQFMDFLEKGLGGASADWSNQKFNAAKGADLSKSIGAKAVLGAQEKRGANKTKVEWKLHHYDCWDLSGKVTDAKLETP